MARGAVGPPFRRIAIVGVGLIGGSIGLALRRRVGSARVTGIDRAAVLRVARARRAVDEGTTRLARGLEGADLVVLALPGEAAIAILPRVARLCPGATLTDVGSTKEAIDRRARRLGLGARFVGGHPMAGSERSGIAHADGRLFEGAPWILCPARKVRGRAAAGGPALRLAALVTRLGARPAVLGPRAHDRIVARLSHLPQLASVALTNAAGRREASPFLHLAGPALREMTRLAESPPALWDGILRANSRAATRALDDFISELRSLRAALRRGPSAHFDRAARIRARIMAHRRFGT